VLLLWNGFFGLLPWQGNSFPGQPYNGFAYYLATSKLQYLGSLYPSGSRTNIVWLLGSSHSSIHLALTICFLLTMIHDDKVFLCTQFNTVFLFILSTLVIFIYFVKTLLHAIAFVFTALGNFV
jgi:hypothetical protein